MRYFALLLILLNATVLFAQPDTLWTRTFGGIGDEYGSGVIARRDGSFIVSGTTNSFGAGASDQYLLHLAPNGDTLWTSIIGNSNDEWCAGMVAAPNGGVYLVGYTFFTAHGGHWDASFGYIDSMGLSRSAGGVGDSAVDYYGFSLCLSPDSCEVFAGSQDFRSGSGNILVMAYDCHQSGNGFLRIYNRGYKSVAHSIKSVSSGGYILGGFTQSSDTTNPDFLLLRINNSGDTLWSRVIGGEGADEINSVIQTADGGFAFTGPTDSYGVNGDVVLFKTDSLGIEQWHRTYGGDGEEHGHIVIQTPDHGYFLAGHTESFGVGGDVIAIKTDSLGNLQWMRHWGGDGMDVAESAALTNDGGYILAGTTTSFGAGSSDIWVLRIAPESSVPHSEPAEANAISLSQNYPNPFNAQTRIRFNLSHPQTITLKLFDLQGRFVQTLAEGPYSAGPHDLQLNADHLPSGLYFYQITAGGFSDTKKMILLK